MNSSGVFVMFHLKRKQHESLFNFCVQMLHLDPSRLALTNAQNTSDSECFDGTYQQI